MILKIRYSTQYTFEFQKQNLIILNTSMDVFIVYVNGLCFMEIYTQIPLSTSGKYNSLTHHV